MNADHSDALRWLVSVLVLCGAMVSAGFYKHANRQYSTGKNRAIPSSNSFRYVYRYLQISTLLLSIACFWSDSLLLLKIHDSEILMMCGATFSVLALVGFIWARLSLADAYSPCFDSFVPKMIVLKGPYRWVRHPIYSTNILMLFGLFIASGSIWILLNVFVLATYYYNAACKEEQILSEEFPEYSRTVMQFGRFIPGRRLTKGFHEG